MIGPIMNTRLLSPRARASSATTRRLWHFNFLGVTLLFCIGIGGLLVPAKNETRDRRLPAHQLAADARTLAAALRYLFEHRRKLMCWKTAISGLIFCWD